MAPRPYGVMPRGSPAAITASHSDKPYQLGVQSS